MSDLSIGAGMGGGGGLLSIAAGALSRSSADALDAGVRLVDSFEPGSSSDANASAIDLLMAKTQANAAAALVGVSQSMTETTLDLLA